MFLDGASQFLEIRGWLLAVSPSPRPSPIRWEREKQNEELAGAASHPLPLSPCDVERRERPLSHSFVVPERGAEWLAAQKPMEHQAGSAVQIMRCSLPGIGQRDGETTHELSGVSPCPRIGKGPKLFARRQAQPTERQHRRICGT